MTQDGQTATVGNDSLLFLARDIEWFVTETKPSSV